VSTPTRPVPKPPARTVEFSRSFPLEDIGIEPGDGRTVRAYAAIFDVPAQIADQDGEYLELIDRGAFTAAINRARPAGGRQAWGVSVLFNHGRSIYGTPSDMFSVPIGVCLDMQADSRGLLTTVRYHKSAENILESIHEGSLRSYSFQGAFLRSTPLPSRGRKYERRSNGDLQRVRRLESTLREFGPTPFPAYSQAEIVGVRADQRVAELSSRAVAQRDRINKILARQIVEGRFGYTAPTSPSADVVEHARFASRMDELCRRGGIDLRERSSQ
jgi:HK97 family phage prohead protease